MTKKEKINILFLTFYYTPDYCAGSFRASAISQALIDDKRVNRFLVVTTIPHRYGFIKNYDKYEVSGKKVIIRNKIPQHNNRFFKQIFTFFVYAIQTIIQSINNRKNYDLIIITSSRFGTAFLGYLVSKITGKPLAIDIRDIFSDGLKSLNISDSPMIKIIIRLITAIEIKIIRHASWINFVSPGFVDFFKHKLNITNPKVYTNGIDKAFIDNRLVNRKKNTNRKKNPFKILYAGNIGYGQSLDKIIIPLAKHFKDLITFKIIGDGSLKDSLFNEIHNNKLLNIKLNEPKNRESLINEYNNADALFINLNDIQAFKRVIPSKIFEYATFEKPVIAGVSGVASQFINDNINGFYIFYPNNFEEAKQQLNKIMNDKGTTKIDNTEFVQKYKRTLIMKSMVNSILEEIWLKG